MRVGGWRVIASGVVACALVALGAGSAAAASWGHGVEAVLPANASAAAGMSGGFARVGSVSCPSAGNCTAVGGYTDNSGRSQPMFLTETAGKWGAGVEPVLPANAGSAPAKSGATVGLVSCASPGNCSAVGTYADSSGNPEGLLLTETDGSWSPGVEAVLPANSLSANQLLQWGSLSCASAGNCTAVGSYSSTGSFFQALLLTETDWIWSTGTDPVPTYSFAWLSSVSCASAGNCTAVGGYTDDSRVGQALLLTETAGSWGPPVAVNLPADYTHSDLATELDSVSCASAGNCTAVGSYDVGEVEVGHDESEERGKGLLLTETAGSWATGVEATMPADAVGPDGVGESAPQVSCPTAGNCSVVLEYYDNNKHVHGLLLSQTAGSWGAGHESPAGRFGNSISCASPGNCGVLVGGTC